MPSKRHKTLLDANARQPLCTLDEVGRALGISRERARQLEARALAKLRKALRARGYQVADFLDVSQ